LIQLTLSNLNVKASFGDPTTRQDAPEIPRSVIREVIANAIAHRDFSLDGGVHVHVGKECLEISNPGHFPPEHPWENLLERPGFSFAPNRRVANHLQKMHGFDGIGRGFLILRDYISKSGANSVHFEQIGNLVICRIMRPRLANTAEFGVELFISRAGSDKDIAVAIANILRDAGYTTFLLDEDFGPSSFMARMEEGFEKRSRGARVLALLSGAYQQSEFCLREARYPLIDDPDNKRGRLIVLRIEECAPTGFLKQLPYIDLVPLLDDAPAFATAVRGAVNPAAPEGAFAVNLRRAPTQILHPEIRAVPGFVSREDLLAGVEQALWQKGGTAALTNDVTSAAVKGLGGVGKSVLAREYAWRARERYHGLWWVRAETEQTLIDDLIELGSRLIPNLKELQERDRALHLALDAIAGAAGDKPWLIVYDNVEKPGAIARLTPKTGAHILITSRWPRWKGHAQEMAVDVFSEEAAVNFLLVERPHESRDAAGQLAAMLGNLPLALSHARAYCAAANLSFYDYARHLSELIQEAPEDAEYPASVFATFSLAIVKAAEACPEAEKLMEIVAFLAPERIPLDIISDDVMSENRRDRAVAALFSVSLITHEITETGVRAFSVHRLLQEVMRSRLGERCQVARRIALHLSCSALDAISVREHANWRRVGTLLPHAIAVLDMVDEGNESEDVGSLCSFVGIYLDARGDYPTAQHYAERALAIAEASFGKDNPNTAPRLSNLAGLYRSQGHYLQAEKLYQRALSITEGFVGGDHPATGACLNNLGGLYQSQGRYAEAELLFQRALAIAEKTLGSGHPDTGIPLANLGNVYESQGRYEAAEPFYVRALAVTEASLGKNHPYTGASLNNLASLYTSLGRYAEAEPLYIQALTIIESSLGRDHPDTGTYLSNLASLYREQGRYAEAEPIYLRALTIAEKALGSDHPATGSNVNNLAYLYLNQGRYTEAEPLFTRAVAIAERTLGKGNAVTGIGLANLALLNQQQGHYGKAALLYKKALAIITEALGPEHPSAVEVKTNLSKVTQEK
jgi:tetratricopeptide (TPR) repeat protein